MPEPSKDEFELVPRSQLDYLRQEVDRIKRNPFGDTRSSKDLLSAMDRLSSNIEKLVRTFETASDEIVRDYKDGANTEKLNRMLEQNEKLAKGIVTIAELFKETHHRPQSGMRDNPFDEEPRESPRQQLPAERQQGGRQDRPPPPPQ